MLSETTTNFIATLNKFADVGISIKVFDLDDDIEKLGDALARVYGEHSMTAEVDGAYGFTMPVCQVDGVIFPHRLKGRNATDEFTFC